MIEDQERGSEAGIYRRIGRRVRANGISGKEEVKEEEEEGERVEADRQSGGGREAGQGHGADP